MLKRERAHQFLKGAVGTAFLTLAGACAHTSDPVYASASYPPASAPQQAPGASATYEAPASVAPGATAAETSAPAPSGTSGPSADSYSDTDPAALQDFHPALDAHGTCTEDPTYGTVWTPSTAETGPGFVPYVSGGHWVYGDDYAWSSDYTWGWAPFHYGRWVHLEARGWSWIPGRDYAPAWVEWRRGDAYVGWSPAPPLFAWRGGVAVTLGFAPPAPPFVYCGHADLFAPQPGRVVIMGPRAVAIGRSTRFYGAPDARGHFHRGPPLASLHIAPEHVVRATGHDRGLARAQAFSRPSSAPRLGARPPATRRAFGETRSQVAQRESAHPKAARAQGMRPKFTRTESPRPKLAHAASPQPKVTHVEGQRPAEGPRRAEGQRSAEGQRPVEGQRPEGRAERQAPEQHQAQRQEAARPEAARSERRQEPSHVETRPEPSHVATRAVSHGSEHNTSPQVTHRAASSSPDAPAHERTNEGSKEVRK